MKTRTLMASLMTAALCGLNLSASADNTGKEEVGPGEVITRHIEREVSRQLKETGASCQKIEVTRADDRDSGTPFDVNYQGLKNFSPNGQAPEPNGKFRMEYIGGGEWQGTLAGQEFTVPVGKTDKIDLPFLDDPQVLGEWVSVDFVADRSQFKPGTPAWKGDLYLKGLTFLAGGKMSAPWWSWTRKVVIHTGDKTASKYDIRQIGGESYLFFEWKSGDVTIAGKKPHYYVLKKKAAQ